MVYRENAIENYRRKSTESCGAWNLEDSEPLKKAKALHGLMFMLRQSSQKL